MPLNTKIPPPIVGLFFAVLIWATAKIAPDMAILSDHQRQGTALVLLIIGFSFAISGMLSFRSAATTVNPLQPEQATALVTSGVYKLTRNPMYIGLAIILLAWTLLLGTPLGLIAVVGFMAYIQRYQIIPEEQALIKLFGAEYDAYRTAVRRWL